LQRTRQSLGEMEWIGDTDVCKNRSWYTTHIF